jgi:hypothetical protein
MAESQNSAVAQGCAVAVGHFRQIRLWPSLND